MRADPATILRDHYRKILPKARKPIDFNPWEYGFTNEPKGLGDCIILSDLPFASYRPIPVTHPNSPAWPAVEGLLRVGSGPFLDKWQRADVAYATYNLGNGHLFQRFRRMWGLDVDEKPFGKLNRIDLLGNPAHQVKNRVALHFDAGKHQGWQKLHIHQQARVVYPENLKTVQDFILERDDLEFLLFGSENCGLEGVKDLTGMELGMQLRAVGTCEWFLGIVSGFMHAAAAYECKSVVILNFPPARKIMLPTLVDTTLVESEWLYPQNVHLHQDNAGPLVPRFSPNTLRAAFDGGVYPYFKEKWLHLIHEKIDSGPVVSGCDLGGVEAKEPSPRNRARRRNRRISHSVAN